MFILNLSKQSIEYIIQNNLIGTMVWKKAFYLGKWPKPLDIDKMLVKDNNIYLISGYKYDENCSHYYRDLFCYNTGKLAKNYNQRN